MSTHKHLCSNCGSVVTCEPNCDEDPYEETLCDRCLNETITDEA